MGSIDALLSRNLHRLLCDFLRTHFCVLHQGTGSALGELAPRTDPDYVADFQYIARTVQLYNQVLVDDDDGGLEVPEHLAGSPLLRVVYAALEGLFGVLAHHILESFQQSEGIGEGTSEPAVDVVLAQLPDFPTVGLDPDVALTDLAVPDDHRLPLVLHRQDGRMMPWTPIRKSAPQGLS